MVNVLHTDDLKSNGSRTATFEGAAHGSGVSFFLVDNDPGQGQELHRHPYTETWVVLAGEVVFTADGREIPAAAGDIVVVGAETPHKFRNGGDDRLQLMCIHASPRFIQDAVEDATTSAPPPP